MPVTSGAKLLSKVQLGREVTAGTAVAATTIWRGIAQTPKAADVKINPEENIGYTVQTSRQYTAALLAEMEFPETACTFEQLPHIFEAGIKTVTPTSDGVGSGKVYTYDMASGDANTIKTYTIEGGNNKTVEEMEYSVVKSFAITGAKKTELKVSANWEGRQSTVSSFTGALSAATVYPMLFQKTKLYIDNVGGTIGTTQILNSFLDFTVNFETGWYMSHTGDGNLYPSFAEYKGAVASLDLTLLHNTTTAAERVLWRSDTPRQIQIKCEGAALTTPGTTYTYRTMILNMAGVYEEFEPPNNDDEGAAVYKVKFRIGYDPTAAIAFRAIVVNELASLP